MAPALPKAVLLDLDDTILDDSSAVDDCWREACVAHRAGFPGLDPAELHAVIKKTAQWFWSDAERHRVGRLELDQARREVVRLALMEAGIEDSGLAARVADTYSDRRDTGIQPLPEAIDTVRWLRSSGCLLALLTNGAGPAQRRKISRFGLADLFDVILVEGEVGFGKPDERIYRLALGELGTRAEDAWMVGDNLEWDVAAPQRLGLFTVWIDTHGRGLPDGISVRPGRVVRSLSALKSEG